jgi:hypothetical protein
MNKKFIELDRKILNECNSIAEIKLYELIQSLEQSNKKEAKILKKLFIQKKDILSKSIKIKDINILFLNNIIKELKNKLILQYNYKIIENNKELFLIKTNLISN